jgi:phage tail sheath gpL-like
MAQTIIKQPDVSITLANADREVSNKAQKALIIGQKVTAGTATVDLLETNILSSGSPEDGLFGVNSQLAGAIRAFRKINPLVQIDAIPLDDDGSGVPRLVTITVVATATEAGTLVVVAGSEKLHRYEIAVADGDSETVIAAAIVAKVNLDLDNPFTASNVAGVVTFTADNDGTVANSHGFEVSGTIAGVTSFLVAETVAGSVDPVLTATLAVATERYQTVLWPYGSATQLDTLLLFLDPRFNIANDIKDGVGFCMNVDTHSALITDGDAENSESLVLFGDKIISEANYEGPSQNEASYIKCAYFAAVRSLRLTEGAAIAQYLTSAASLDQFGGPALASLPYFNTIIPQLPVVASGRGFTAVQIGTLQASGISVMGGNITGTNALVGEVVTTYKTDAASNVDATFSFLNYVDTTSNCREYFFNNYKKRFAQSRLTTGNVSRGREMANAVIIIQYTEQLYKDLSGVNFVLVQDGEDAFVYFKKNITIVLDLENGKVTITMFLPIITQLRVIQATIKIAFSLED